MSAQGTTSSLNTSTIATEHVFLAGRPPLGEFLGFISSQSVDHSTSDLGSLTQAWCDANDRFKILEESEKGLADSAAVDPLVPELEQLGAGIVASPLVKRQYAIAPFEVGMIELDRLVVFQKNINLEHVRSIRNALGNDPPADQVFRMCLPLDDSRADPRVNGTLVSQQPNASQFAVSSPSSDLRVLESQIVDASAIPSLQFAGVPAKVIVVPIGYTVNFLSALRVNGRLLLSNGSHRAYALREAGFTHAPALVQNIGRRDLLEVMVGADVHGRYDDYFTAPRPPMLKDYFDERLRVIVRVASKVRQINVLVQHSQLDAPAAA
jgi:hypothetical protein